MEKTYNPKYIEQHWAKIWEESGYFSPSGKGDPYCIVIPPPNVTGTLHMGHGFQHTLMDVLIRYHRMQGFNTLWQVGTDHAGIATQMVVLQQLIAQGKKPSELTREEFLQHAWKWKEKSQGNISGQMRRLGISVDWRRERFTLDDNMSLAVQKAFIDLYKEGLIYRGKRLVNWDPVLRTAVSDLEVISEEQDGFLWHISYPVEDSKEAIIVATTRPETMLGDAAVAVHPEDERYQELIGKYVRLPLTERRIPIIADDYVDREFGTGCVKITPAHDFNDYQVGQRHDLPMLNIFTPDAKINADAPGTYTGLDRFAARKKIIHDLKEAHFLVKAEPYKVKVPKGDRSDAIIEPYLTDQWYVKATVLAKPAIEAVTQGHIKFVPENWAKTYLQWLENIEDWCISRQLWWGHRIPAWYDEQQNIYVGHNEQEVREQYQLDKNVILHQDNDVLDTWFSSALWPFATMGWPQKTPELATFYPTSVLVTGFDIIFFWVARMVMMGLKFIKQVPFKEVYITGLIRDAEGQKMSKSKGNILDPIDLVDGIGLDDLVKKRTYGLMQPGLEQKIAQATRREFPEGIKAHGMDALRFTFCALASTGRDINFDVNRLEGYRNFCNKIWNATRFVMMQPREHFNKKPTLADYWIRSRLHSTIRLVEEALSEYRFDLMAQHLYDFIWKEYCDWYLELCKAEQNTSSIMLETLESILRLIHPIMPFISEEIWQQVGPLVGKNGSLMLQLYPLFDEQQIDQEAIDNVALLQKIIISVRNIRGEMNIPPNKELPLLLKKGSAKDRKVIEHYQHYLITLAHLASVAWTDEKLTAAATAVIGELELYIPLANIIDLSAERDRLHKEVTKLQKDIDYLAKKLNDVSFLDKAPKDIVNKEKLKLEEKQTILAKLKQQLLGL